jgi:quercetin dioxygenase-like cupin family protein
MPRIGAWYENFKTKEIAHVRVSPEDTGGRLLEVDLWLAPGARVPAEHVHDRLVERFTVVEGKLGVLVGGCEMTAACGDSVLVPAGEPHDWWNACGEMARVRVRVEATSGSGPMAARFAAMIEAGFGLANTGRTNDNGLPTPLWLASLAHEYRDVIRCTKPPRAVQRIILGPLARLGRHFGRDATAGWLHGPGCPAQIAAPAAIQLAAALV